MAISTDNAASVKNLTMPKETPYRVFLNGIPAEEMCRRMSAPEPNIIWRALFWLALGPLRRNYYSEALLMAREYGCLNMRPWRAAKIVLSARG